MLRPFRDAADTRCDAEIVPLASSSAAYSAEDSEAPGALSACFPADLRARMGNWTPFSLYLPFMPSISAIPSGIPLKHRRARTKKRKWLKKQGVGKLLVL